MFPTSAFLDLALPVQEDLVGNSLNAAICGSLIAFIVGTLAPCPGASGPPSDEPPSIVFGMSELSLRGRLVSCASRRRSYVQ